MARQPSLRNRASLEEACPDQELVRRRNAVEACAPAERAARHSKVAREARARFSSSDDPDGRMEDRVSERWNGGQAVAEQRIEFTQLRGREHRAVEIRRQFLAEIVCLSSAHDDCSCARRAHDFEPNERLVGHDERDDDIRRFAANPLD